MTHNENYKHKFINLVSQQQEGDSDGQGGGVVERSRDGHSLGPAGLGEHLCRPPPGDGTGAEEEEQHREIQIILVRGEAIKGRRHGLPQFCRRKILCKEEGMLNTREKRREG